MNLIPTLLQFLIAATDLPEEQIQELYNAGHPWPLWTAHDIRKAGVRAHAKAMLFPDALAELDASADGHMNAVFATLKEDDRAKGSISLAERKRAFAAFPWFREILGHVDKVVARTTAARSMVIVFSFAVQRYVILHPGWELDGAFPQTPPESVC